MSKKNLCKYLINYCLSSHKKTPTYTRGRERESNTINSLMNCLLINQILNDAAFQYMNIVVLCERLILNERDGWYFAVMTTIASPSSSASTTIEKCDNNEVGGGRENGSSSY